MSGWLHWSGSRAAGSGRAELGTGPGLAGPVGQGLVARLPAMRGTRWRIEAPLLGICLGGRR